MSKTGKILVSGASGFIGSNLVPKLCFHNYQVVAITRSKDISKFFQHENLKWISSEDMILSEDILKSCDTLIHLASAGVDQEENYNLVELFKVNVINSYKLILNCLNQGFKRIIYIGSCFEYGYMPNIKGKPLSVYDALMPKDQYSATKAALTSLLYPLTKYFKSEIRIIRAFNIYGPNEKENRLYPTLMQSIKDKREVSITKGSQKKYFTPVSFLVDSIIRILKKKPKESYFSLENLGGGKLLSVIEFTKTLFKQNHLNFKQFLKFDKKSREGEASILSPNLNERFEISNKN